MLARVSLYRVSERGGVRNFKNDFGYLLWRRDQSSEHLMGIPKRGPFPFYWSFRERNPFFSAGKG